MRCTETAAGFADKGCRKSDLRQRICPADAKTRQNRICRLKKYSNFALHTFRGFRKRRMRQVQGIPETAGRSYGFHQTI